MSSIEKTLDKLESIISIENINFDYGFDLINKNYATGKNYTGLFNNITLSIAKSYYGYKLPYWIGFHQSVKSFIPVKAGEKGIPIMIKQSKNYYTDKDGNQVELSKDDNKDDFSCETKSFWNTVYVFNIEQTSADLDSINKFEYSNDFSDVKNLLDNYMNREKIGLGISDNYCKYSRDEDKIYMVSWDSFYNKTAYYASLAHECIHSTGHEKRKNRLFGKYGDSDYSNEELIAELGSMMILSEFDITSGEKSSGAYIKSWMKGKKVKDLYSFCMQAQDAINFIKKGINSNV